MKPEDSALFTFTELVFMSGRLAVVVVVGVGVVGVVVLVVVLVLVEAGVLAVEESVGKGVDSMD